MMEKIKYIISLFEKYTLNFKVYGRGTIIKFPFYIYGRRNIELGTNVFIAENSSIAVDKSGKAKLIIGNDVQIGNNIFITCTNKIVIEDKVLISARVFVGDNIHGYEDVKLPIIDQPLITKGEVVLKKGCFIGINAVILPGVTVGCHAIVGANAVVSKSVPDFSVVVGNPARVIKALDKKTNKWKRVNQN